jgi:hypothetical protein
MLIVKFLLSIDIADRESCGKSWSLGNGSVFRNQETETVMEARERRNKIKD